VLTSSPTLPCWPLRMSLESARKSESPLSTSSSGLPVVPEPSSPVQEDRPLSELSPVPVCESVELKTSPLPHPTLPGRRVVDEDEGFRMGTLFILGKSVLSGSWSGFVGKARLFYGFVLQSYYIVDC